MAFSASLSSGKLVKKFSLVGTSTQTQQRKLCYARGDYFICYFYFFLGLAFFFVLSHGAFIASHALQLRNIDPIQNHRQLACAPLPPSRAAPPCFAHSSVAFQRSRRQACSAPAPPLALPGTLSACVPPAASSIRKSTAGTNLALDKTLSHSVRYVPARKPAFATSSRLSLSAWSCRNIALRRESLQDAVRVALTEGQPQYRTQCRCLCRIVIRGRPSRIKPFARCGLGIPWK